MDARASLQAQRGCKWPHITVRTMQQPTSANARAAGSAGTTSQLMHASSGISPLPLKTVVKLMWFQVP